MQIFGKTHKKRERWLDQMKALVRDAERAAEGPSAEPVDRDTFVRHVAEATNTYLRDKRIKPDSPKEAKHLKKLVAFAFGEAHDVVTLGALDARLYRAGRSHLCERLDSGARHLVYGHYEEARKAFGRATGVMEAMGTADDDQAFRDAKTLEQIAKHLAAYRMKRGIAALEKFLETLADRPAGDPSRQQVNAVRAALDFAEIKDGWLEHCAVLPEDEPYENPRDIKRDERRDAKRDPGRDAERDRVRDATRDRERDAKRDAELAAAVNRARDAEPGTSRAAASETSRDVAADTAQNASADSAADVAAHAGPDVVAATAPDAVMETPQGMARETSVDAGRELALMSGGRGP